MLVLDSKFKHSRFDLQIFINQLGKVVSTELKQFEMGSSPERRVTKNHANEDTFETHDK